MAENSVYLPQLKFRALTPLSLAAPTFPGKILALWADVSRTGVGRSSVVVVLQPSNDSGKWRGDIIMPRGKTEDGKLVSKPRSAARQFVSKPIGANPYATVNIAIWRWVTIKGSEQRMSKRDDQIWQN